MSVSNKTLENLTRNEYVGLALAGVLVLGVGYFIISKFFSGVKDTANAAANLGRGAVKAADNTLSQIGELAGGSADANDSSFVSWYDPTQHDYWFYWLLFPDGVHHFLGAGSVRSDGTFDYSDGVQYKIGYDKIGDLRAYAVG